MLARHEIKFCCGWSGAQDGCILRYELPKYVTRFKLSEHDSRSDIPTPPDSSVSFLIFVQMGAVESVSGSRSAAACFPFE